jgi:hypothetical protein
VLPWEHLWVLPLVQGSAIPWVQQPLVGGGVSVRVSRASAVAKALAVF